MEISSRDRFVTCIYGILVVSSWHLRGFIEGRQFVDMSYRKHQIIGFGSVLFLLLLAFGIILVLVTSTVRNTDQTITERLANVELASDFKNSFYMIDSELGYLVNPAQTGDTEERLANFQLYFQTAQEQLGMMDNLTSSDESAKLIQAIQSQYDTYLGVVAEAIEALVEEDASAAGSLLATDAQLSRSALIINLDSFVTYQNNQVTAAQEQSKELFRYLWVIIGGLVIGILIISSIIAAWVVRGTTKSLNRITDTITQVDFANAEQLPRLQLDSGDEMNNIADAFNEMADTLEAHNRQVRELREEQEEKNFIQSTLAEAAHVYQGLENTKELGEAFLQLIAPKISAAQAAIYLRIDEGEETVLKCLATYAVVGSELSGSSFRLGEGLIGQAALGNKRLILKELPPGYLIASGLGRSTPTSVLIQPVAFKQRVEAVIEFASLEGFVPLHERLLDLLCDTFGIAVNSVQNRAEVNRLLERSQLLTEELQTQAEELTTQQERMKLTNERLEEQYRDSESKSSELELVSRELERYADQLEQASRYKTEFLANMSHELRTPLNSILILSQMIAENRQQLYEAEDTEYASIIQRAGQDLLLIIGDILDLSKVEAGMVDIITETVVVEDLIDVLEESFGKIALTKGLDFSVEIAEHVPLMLSTDGKRLRQILKNLVSNAIKFTSKGQVRVEIEQGDPTEEVYPVDAGTEGRVWIFRVRDTGIGIPLDKQEYIFHAFEQARNTTSRDYGGTGLGLSICREFARLLGGTVNVDSISGEGSVFTLYLPEAKLEEAELAETSDEVKEVAEPVVETALEGLSILLVDDDERNVFSLQEYLEERGMKVQVAWNGQEAIDLLNEGQSYDLVLMDLMMPVKDGYTAIREIRSDSRHEKLPIIAMTAKAMKTDREECIAAGASDYLSKPLNMKQLMSLVHVWTTPAINQEI